MVRNIMLLGASVGRDWRFPELPLRTGLRGIRCEFRGLFVFDKTPVLDQVLYEEQAVPDVIVLKECAAYFPGDHDDFTALTERWVDQCLEAGVAPWLATVIPVVRRSGVLPRLGDYFRRVRGRTVVSDRLISISRFNDWVRNLAARRGLALLDLERTLRISRADRSLRPDLHSGDGLHLNKSAYSMLDEAMFRMIQALPERSRTEEE